MSNSLQKHGIREAHKQLHTRMKRDGLESVEVHVTRQAGKLKFDFTGSKEQVVKAQKILADWN
jgi:N-methylhydantoinase B/oxoprolinase/acetone carboxylase alpha subunit